MILKNGQNIKQTPPKPLLSQLPSLFRPHTPPSLNAHTHGHCLFRHGTHSQPRFSLVRTDGWMNGNARIANKKNGMIDCFCFCVCLCLFSGGMIECRE
jgi:hypothetical protein